MAREWSRRSIEEIARKIGKGLGGGLENLTVSDGNSRISGYGQHITKLEYVPVNGITSPRINLPSSLSSMPYDSDLNFRFLGFVPEFLLLKEQGKVSPTIDFRNYTWHEPFDTNHHMLITDNSGNTLIDLDDYEVGIGAYLITQNVAVYGSTISLNLITLNLRGTDRTTVEALIDNLAVARYLTATDY